jgi:hypothetical protein
MATRRQARVGRSASGRFFRRGVLVAALALALASTGCVDETETAEVVLDYGPILRGVDARSARFLFHAARPDGSEVPWQAGIEISRSPDLDRDTLLPAPVVEVAAPHRRRSGAADPLHLRSADRWAPRLRRRLRCIPFVHDGAGPR